MDTNEKNKILETILTIFTSIVLVLIGSYYLPFLIFLYPIPLVVLGIRHGLKENIISSITIALIIGMLLGPVSGIFLLILFLPLTIGLNYGIEKNKKPLEVLGVNTIILMISFLIIMAIIGNLSDISILDQLEDSFAQLLTNQMKLLEDMDYSSYELSQIRDMMENAIDYMLLIFPSMVMIFSFILTSINYVVISKLLKKWGKRKYLNPSFSKFKLPDNVLIGIAIMLIATLLLKRLDLFYYDTVVLNITVSASFMFVVQGLSVIDHKLIGMNVRKFLRVIIIVLLIVILPIGWLISFLGVLDILFDFRKIGKKAES